MKIIRVNDCLGCPNRLFNYEEITSKIKGWWCRIDEERHTLRLEDKEVPSWCPLEDCEDLDETKKEK